MFNGTEYLVVNPKTMKPFTDIQKELDRCCRAARVNRITLYHLKHLATTVLLDLAAGDTDLVKRVVGWSSEQMGRRFYGHLQKRHIDLFGRFARLLEEKRAVVNGGHVGLDVTTRKKSVVDFEVNT